MEGKTTLLQYLSREIEHRQIKSSEKTLEEFIKEIKDTNQWFFIVC